MNVPVSAHPEVRSSIRLFDAWAATQVAYRTLPGLAFGVVYDQELIWARGYGYADLARQVPATQQTIYRIASITKLFTATAILQLRDDGRLNLDDPVARRLPWFQIRQPHQDAAPITIRQLLTHTSGLPREAAFPYWTDGNFPTRDELIAALPDQAAVFPPLTQWKYSNLALVLAGEIVAAVAQQPYAGYVQAHILQPLGMQRTSVVLPDGQRDALGTPYGRRLPDGSRTIQPFTDCQGITPAANMSTTVEDLARFASLQLRDGPAGGSQILKGSSLREMRRVQWLNPDWLSGWGLGFMIRRREEQTLIEHGGSVPGFRTLLSICPADKLAFIALTNADDGEPGWYVEQAYAMIAPAVRQAATRAVEAVQEQAVWQRYVGTYRNLWSDAEVLITHRGLELLTTTVPDPGSARVQLIPEGEHTFRIHGDNGYESIGELAVFELGPDGAVVRLKVGANYTYPQAERPPAQS
jgi:CubicO group peptidase (beta-lactamase class C family)